MTEYYNNSFVQLDADHQGHIIVFLCDYHNWLTELWEREEINDKDYADTCYLIGNFEGRALHNGLMVKDIELIEEWELEYNAAQAN
jgi:hypothetical protein